MTKFKPGQWVERVRNSTCIPDEGLSLRIGQKMRIERISYGALFGDKGGVAANAADCELVEEVCECCGQALPKPKTLTVPAHEIPAPLDVEPDDGDKVFVVSAESSRGCIHIRYRRSYLQHKQAFLLGLLYATEAEAQARYESWVAPTRRGEEKQNG